MKDIGNVIWNSEIVWPRPLVEAIEKYLDDSLDSSSSDDNKKIDIEKLISHLVPLFSTKKSPTFKEKLEVKLRNDLPKEKLSVGRLLTFLEPYLRESLDMNDFNTRPQFKIGISGVVTQYQNYLMQRGLDFNIMIVGRAGSGKSTLINTLFNSIISRRYHGINPSPVEMIQNSQTNKIHAVRHIIQEEGVLLRLCVYDTPGYGDLIDNTQCSSSIVSKIKQLYNSYLKRECEVDRDPLKIDERIHCCLYVIPPTGHCLSELDIKCLKEINELVNVIPLIGRADSLDLDEIQSFKDRIKKDLQANNISTFPKVRHEVWSSIEDQEPFNLLSSKMPLAVIGANSTNTSTKSLVRKNAYSEININDPSVCDFSLLVDVLIRKHMLSLIHTTDKLFYERHRKSVMQLS